VSAEDSYNGMKRRIPAAVVMAAIAAMSLCGATKAPVPRPRPKPPAAVQPAPPASDGVTDLSHAIPLKAISGQPSTETQFRVLNEEIAKDKPAVAVAKTTSEDLARQAELLQRKLVVTAARVVALESEKVRLDSDIVRLTAEDKRLSSGFARDRVSVARLLAILERLQHDMPPAIALRPDDALSAARGAMLIGASLPEVYGRAATLSRRLGDLRRTRIALIDRRAAAVKNADTLAQSRVELDQLLAMKRLEADAAQTRYGDLKRRLDIVASQSANLQVLLQRVAALRAAPATQNVVTVTAQKDAGGGLKRGTLLTPVVGEPTPGGLDGVGGSAAPGLTYVTAPGAQVISPADGTVLFAGPYHKSGQVLILQLADGYDAVLAGLDRLEVRPDNHILAGEPVGAMSKFGLLPRLYFELRQNGRGINPAPYMTIALRKAKRS